MREIQPRTAAIAVQAHGKTIATITTNDGGHHHHDSGGSAQVNSAALAAGVDAAAVNKVKKLV